MLMLQYAPLVFSQIRSWIIAQLAIILKQFVLGRQRQPVHFLSLEVIGIFAEDFETDDECED